MILVVYDSSDRGTIVTRKILIMKRTKKSTYSYKIYHLHLTAEGYFTKGSFLIGLALKGNF